MLVIDRKSSKLFRKKGISAWGAGVPWPFPSAGPLRFRKEKATKPRPLLSGHSSESGDSLYSGCDCLSVLSLTHLHPNELQKRFFVFGGRGRFYSQGSIMLLQKTRNIKKKNKERKALAELGHFSFFFFLDEELLLNSQASLTDPRPLIPPCTVRPLKPGLKPANCRRFSLFIQTSLGREIRRGRAHGKKKARSESRDSEDGEQLTELNGGGEGFWGGARWRVLVLSRSFTVWLKWK